MPPRRLHLLAAAVVVLALGAAGGCDGSSRGIGSGPGQQATPSASGTTPPTPQGTTDTSRPSSPATAPSPRPRTALLVAAGDIACNPMDRKFGVGLGEETGCRHRATSDLIAALHPAAVMPLGDTQYQHGTYRGYLTAYAPTWGRFRSITHPVIGNHEYDTPRASGYFGYFGRAAGDPRKGYYSYELGRWHVVVLNNSGCDQIGGCGKGSPQERWLQRDLAAHRTRCTLAAFHEPRWSSGDHGDSTRSEALWADLYAGGVDVTLSGHDHDYERFTPFDGTGRPDRAGIRSFVVGTGGVGLKGLGPPAAGSVVRNNDTFGVLALRLRPGDYDWRFVPVGDGFRDSGRGTCH
jgi:hypothetical protein